MTEVSFYHLQHSTLEVALPKLLEKTLAAGKRAVVRVGSAQRVDSLNRALWDYRSDSWLPHGGAKDGQAEEQPIWLTAEEENPNGATFLFLADGAASEKVGEFERCFELFNGHDDAAVQVARDRWKEYKEAGYTVAYWQQNDRGAWEQKA